jgi:hypothetical protein
MISKLDLKQDFSRRGSNRSSSESSQTVGKCRHSGCTWITSIQCKEIYEQCEFVVFFAMALDSRRFGASSGALLLALMLLALPRNRLNLFLVIQNLLRRRRMKDNWALVVVDVDPYSLFTVLFMRQY